MQKDLQAKGDDMMETIQSVEAFLAEHGEDLSPEERAKLQAALAQMKEQYHTLTDTAKSSLAQLDSTINTTLQQNTQRVKTSRKYCTSGLSFSFSVLCEKVFSFPIVSARLKRRSSCRRLREK